MASLTRSKLAVWIARHLLVAGLSLTAAFLLLGYLFIFRPQIADIRNADRVALLTEEHDAKVAYLARLDALGAQYASVAPEDRERLYQIIPSEMDMPGVLTILQAAAAASDAQLMSVNFSPGDTAGLPPGTPVSAVIISMSIQHVDYARFKLFLAGLESNLRLFDVRSASIDPENAAYTLTIRAYVRSAPAPVGVAPTNPITPDL